MRRSLQLWFACAVFAAAGTTLVSSCGVTTHNVIGHRALQFFQSTGLPLDYADIAKRNQDSFQAGCAFPDFGYACPLKTEYPQLPNASECAHWTPFIHSLGKFVRDELPPPSKLAQVEFANLTKLGWEPNSYPEKVVAFFMGVLSHQTADILWHDLEIVFSRTQQGFIQVLAEVDYNAWNHTYLTTAHTEADFGGEFMCAYEIPLDFIQTKWYLPTEAAVWAFRHLGFTEAQLNRDSIESCFVMLYAEVEAISDLASELLFPVFADKSPFLVENFQEEFIGGVDDMAAWTGRCWTKGLTVLSNSTDRNVCLIDSQWRWPLGLSRERISEREKAALSMRARIPDEILRKHVPAFVADAQGLTLQRRPEPRPLSSSFSHRLSRQHSQARTPQTSTSSFFESSVPGALLGHAIASGDLNGDGCADVAVGAPGFSSPSNGTLYHRGAVFVFFGCKERPAGGMVPDISWMGVRSSHFGSSVEILDLNSDGKQDLVIGAPRTRTQELEYVGEVQIFYGPLHESKQGPVVAPKADLVFSPLAASAKFATFGSRLFALDVTGDGVEDLVIGAPLAPGYLPEDHASLLNWQHGQLYFYKAGSVPSLRFTLSGLSPYERFGHAVTVANGPHGQRLLLVGAPLYNHNANAERSSRSGEHGRLSVFDISDTERKMPQLIMQVVGDVSYSKVGFAVAATPIASNICGVPGDGSSILLSLPTLESPAMHFWDENQVQAGTTVLISARTLLGARAFATYGASDQTPSVNVSYLAKAACAEFKSEQEYSRLGWACGFEAAGNTDFLWMTEPYRNTEEGGVDSGAVYIFTNKTSPRGIIVDIPSAATLSYSGSSPAALLGRSGFYVADFNGDGRADGIIGSPRSRTFDKETNTFVVNGGRVDILNGFLHVT